MKEPDEDYEDDDSSHDGDLPYPEDCHRCGGSGEINLCPDDLCHGQEECIHGDGIVICPDCKGGL